MVNIAKDHDLNSVTLKANKSRLVGNIISPKQVQKNPSLISIII